MSCFKTDNLRRLSKMSFLVVVTTMSAAPWSSTQVMQKGISVELAPTSSAVRVPGADNQDAVIITVTDSGKFYLSESILSHPLRWRKSSRIERLIARRIFISRPMPGRLTPTW
jgi:biopolymer transport protein ExbD